MLWEEDEPLNIYQIYDKTAQATPGQSKSVTISVTMDVAQLSNVLPYLLVQNSPKLDINASFDS